MASIAAAVGADECARGRLASDLARDFGRIRRVERLVITEVLRRKQEPRGFAHPEKAPAVLLVAPIRELATDAIVTPLLLVAWGTLNRPIVATVRAYLDAQRIALDGGSDETPTAVSEKEAGEGEPPMGSLANSSDGQTAAEHVVEPIDADARFDTVARELPREIAAAVPDLTDEVAILALGAVAGLGDSDLNGDAPKKDSAAHPEESTAGPVSDQAAAPLPRSQRRDKRPKRREPMTPSVSSVRATDDTGAIPDATTTQRSHAAPTEETNNPPSTDATVAAPATQPAAAAGLSARPLRAIGLDRFTAWLAELAALPVAAAEWSVLAEFARAAAAIDGPAAAERVLRGELSRILDQLNHLGAGQFTLDVAEDWSADRCRRENLAAAIALARDLAARVDAYALEAGRREIPVRGLAEHHRRLGETADAIARIAGRLGELLDPNASGSGVAAGRKIGDSEFRRLEKEHRDLWAQHEALDRERERLADEVSKRDRDIERLNAQIERLDSENARLTHENQSLAARESPPARGRKASRASTISDSSARTDPISTADGETDGASAEEPTLPPLGPPPSNPPVKTVTDAVERAAAEFPERLLFLQSAYESAGDAPFVRPEEIYRSLWALGKTAEAWASAPPGASLGGDLRQEMARYGVADFKSHISQTAQAKWGRNYTFKYLGKDVVFAAHVTIGARSPNTCLSIHVHPDRELRVIVVGYVGRHLKNTKS
ncbi:MAG: hypothetical protein EPO26_00050 [Chloroflexota bacterium]|nr:MAG: hypothetical protein EPO26_00050 [Chloroflexota bacterium]